MSAPERRVLLVEDNADNLYLATLLLEKEGFTVVPAMSGVNALERLAAEPYTLVLLDLQLPDMDGIEIATRIRSTHPAEQLPIIAVSAMAMAMDRRRAFAAGCNGYLEKPIDAEVFVAQVRCLAGIAAA